jgi:hypothetical protein
MPTALPTGVAARRSRLAWLGLLLGLAVVLGSPAPAGAAVMIGSSLAQEPTEVMTCNPGGGLEFACTFQQEVIPGRQVASPVAGVVTRWRLRTGAGSSAQNVRLRVGRAAGANQWVSAGTSAPVPISTSAATTLYATRLPIQA